MPVNDQALLDYVAAHSGSRRGEIRRHVAAEASDATIWRALKRLVEQGRLAVSGNGPATGYTLAGADAVQSHLQTPYSLRAPTFYRKEFLDSYVPGTSFYLSEAERADLHGAGRPTGAELDCCLNECGLGDPAGSAATTAVGCASATIAARRVGIRPAGSNRRHHQQRRTVGAVPAFPAHFVGYIVA